MDKDMALPQIEKAKAFWGNVDVDRLFDELLQHLVHLRESIKENTASDKEYLQALNVIQECGINEAMNMKHFSIEQVVIGEDFLKSDLGSLRPLEDIVPEQDMSYDDSQDLEPANYQTPVILDPRDPLTPLSPHQDMFDLVLLSPPPYSLENTVGYIYSPQPEFEPHECSPACLNLLPPHPDHFLGQNPLRAPLLCRFRRHCSGKARYSDDGEMDSCDEEGEDVFYTAPCGLELNCFDEVLLYLHQTEALGALQPWNFSFHPEVHPELPPLTMATTLCKRDLSRGIESVAVQLCNEVDSAPLAEFRYRRERWPHGCFLSTGELFSACCNCTDGCTDALNCACLQLAQKGAGGAPVQLYSHQRLQEQVPTGLYECSPWCGCDPFHCLNRVVQHGVRVRLQVFRRQDHCWGVRCRDDLDEGTFVCTYAGVVLRTEQSSEEPPVAKLAREEPLSDDEVEVVEEWTLPAQPPTGSSAAATDPCSPSHIPVIQRPADHAAPATNGHKETVKTEGQECVSPVGNVAEEKMETENKRQLAEERPHRDDPKLRTGRQGDVRKFSSSKQHYFLDATKEGNVGRFINRSPSPNLFVQSVFIDTHDPQFPIMAFFTSRTVKAGTELTWSCSHDDSGD